MIEVLERFRTVRTSALTAHFGSFNPAPLSKKGVCYEVLNSSYDDAMPSLP
jgi:hypothetical protein